MDPKVAFVNLNSIPTKVLIYDESLDSSTFDPETSIPKFQRDRMILMISGNPGEIEYYHEYLLQLHSKTKLPVIGLSNSGHNRIPETLAKPELTKENAPLFGLDSQVLHKAKFIQDFIEPSCKLIIAAHSIGCYILLELLDRYEDINKMIEHCIMIFPTIDSMIETRPGYITNIMFQYFYYPIIALAHCLDFILSEEIKSKIFRSLLQLDGHGQAPDCVVQSAKNLLKPYCLKTTILMVLDEFRYVRDPKIDIIKKNAQKISLFYGEADQWAPIHYYTNIRKKLESCLDRLDLRLCLGQMDHAFVMEPDSVDKICQLTYQVIKKKWNI